MPGEWSLFGDDDADDNGSHRIPETPMAALPEWQVAAIRTALDRAGLVEIQARQGALERLVGRPVESLRALTASEASRVREGLVTRSQPAASSWDDREEDTWIDKL